MKYGTSPPPRDVYVTGFCLIRVTVEKDISPGAPGGRRRVKRGNSIFNSGALEQEGMPEPDSDRGPVTAISSCRKIPGAGPGRDRNRLGRDGDLKNSFADFPISGFR